MQAVYSAGRKEYQAIPSTSTHRESKLEAMLSRSNVSICDATKLCAGVLLPPQKLLQRSHTYARVQVLAHEERRASEGVNRGPFMTIMRRAQSWMPNQKHRTNA